MAEKKKTNKTNIDTEMDFSDLDDLGEDMDFDDGLDDPERSPSRSEVVKDLAKDAGNGFVESMAKKTAEKSLPSEYSANYTEVLDLASFGADVVDRNKTKIDKSMFKLGQEVKKLLPMQIGLLDKYLAKKEEEFSEFKQQSEEEMRSGAIASEVSSIFDKQLDIQKSIEAKRSAEDQVSTKERLVSTKLTLDVLRSIDANAATSAAFAVQISKEYFRTSLGLQYKSFYVQADMLRTMRDHYKAFAIQFSNIEKNTGLPEFVKLKNTERLSEILRTNATQAVYGQIFDRNKYMQTVKNRISNKISEKVTSFTDSVGDVTDALSMMNDGGKGAGLRALGSIGASMGGSALGEMAANKVSPKIAEYIKDNKQINTGANYLKAFAASPATLFRTMRDNMAAKEYEAEGSNAFTAKLYGMARSGLELTDEERPNISIKKDSYLDHNQPAIFDNRVHRSITEVIPQYLAQILKQNTDLTTMFYSANQHIVKRPNTQALMFDYRGRKLDTAANIKASVEENVFTQKATTNRTKVIAANTLGKSKSNIARNTDLSKEDRKKLSATLNSKKGQDALSDYYAKASSLTNVSMDYDTLITKSSDNKDLAALINENPELAKVINVLRQHSDKDNTYIDKGLTDIQNPYPIEAIKNLFTDASKLTRAKQPNLVTDKNATAISKALSRFILNRGEDITVTNVTSRLAFSFFKPDEFNDQIKQNIAVLIDDVKRVENSGDMVIRSSMTALMALVNQSLKANFEIDPSVYTNIQSMYPDFVKSGKLTVENLTEGKFSESAEDSYVSFSDVRDATTVSRRDMEATREEVFATSGLQTIMNRVKTKSDSYRKALADTKGSPTAMAEFLMGEAKSFKSTVQGSLSKTSKELTTGFNRLGTYVDSIVKEGSAKGLSLAVRELGTIDAKLQNYIELTKSDLAQRAEELRAAKDSVSEITTQTGLQRAAAKELEFFIRMGEKNLAGLQKVRESVKRSQESLVQLSQSTTPTPTEILSRMGTAIRDVLDQAKKQLAELEAAGASHRLTPVG